MTVKWLARLLWSPRADHAVQQTVLDWRHEVQETKTLAANWFCHLRSTLSLLRVIVAVSFTDAGRVVSAEWLLRLVFWAAFIAWLSYTPPQHYRGATADGLAVEALLRGVAALSAALQFGAALTLVTGRASRRAPVLAFVALTWLTNTVIGRIVVPLVQRELPPAILADYSGQLGWPWAVIIAVSLLSTVLILTAECLRTDDRRFLASAIVMALPALMLFERYAFAIAIWLNGLGVVGDTVFLPRLRVPLEYLSPWITTALILPILAWLVWRRERHFRKQATSSAK